MIKMVILPLCLLLCSAVVVNAASGGYNASWAYVADHNGALANWTTNYALCGGSSQSPINVLTKHVTYNKDLGSLQLHNYTHTGSNIYFNMENKNTDIAFSPVVTSGKTPQAVSFKGSTYRFHQFHFHWGSKNVQGSEHLVDWQQYAAEMHIIHYNTKYSNVTEAIAKSDGLLVWGHFLKVDSTNLVSNTVFQQLLDNFTMATECCNKTKLGINLFDLLPKKHKDFYYYSGSLTTPPCYESVTWIVNRNPILVSENQMTYFRSLKNKLLGGMPLVDHYRPAQALNGRNVESNFKLDDDDDDADDDDDDDSAGIPVKPCSFLVLSVVAAMVYVF